MNVYVVFTGMADMTKSFEDLDQKDSVVILILNIDNVLIIRMM